MAPQRRAGARTAAGDRAGMETRAQERRRLSRWVREEAGGRAGERAEGSLQGCREADGRG